MKINVLVKVALALLIVMDSNGAAPKIPCNKDFFEMTYEQTMINRKSFTSIVKAYLKMFKLNEHYITVLKNDLETARAIIPEYVSLYLEYLKECDEQLYSLLLANRETSKNKLQKTLALRPEFADLHNFKKTLYTMFDKWSESIKIFIKFLNYKGPLVNALNMISLIDISPITNQEFNAQYYLKRQLDLVQEIFMDAIEEHVGNK